MHGQEQAALTSEPTSADPASPLYLRPRLLGPLSFLFPSTCLLQPFSPNSSSINCKGSQALGFIEDQGGGRHGGCGVDVFIGPG